MSTTHESVQRLVKEGAVRISEHGYDELSADGILAREVIEGVAEAIVVEDYPEYPKGPCVLALQKDVKGHLIHVVWVFRRAIQVQRCLSQLIGQIRNYGKKDF